MNTPKSSHLFNAMLPSLALPYLMSSTPIAWSMSYLLLPHQPRERLFPLAANLTWGVGNSLGSSLGTKFLTKLCVTHLDNMDTLYHLLRVLQKMPQGLRNQRHWRSSEKKDQI